MKKLTHIVLLLVLPIATIFAQSPSYMVKGSGVMADSIQRGTAAIVKGKVVIDLNENIKQLLADRKNGIVHEYDVLITPRCNCQFTISDKDHNSFTILNVGNCDGNNTFDYVIYVKAFAASEFTPVSPQNIDR